MSYYQLLGLAREPFSTSPDPHFLFLSESHRAALYRVRIAIGLQRGLSLIVGDVGTGKTTLSRRLAQLLPEDGPIDFHVILNPYFDSDQQFLAALLESFHAPLPEAGAEAHSVRSLLVAAERYLFRRAVEERRTVVLLIDEAQQLSRSNLEILRALLNYETHDTKLLQVILLAQVECVPILRSIRNLWDRISLHYTLNPLDEAETRQMIAFRLAQADYKGRQPLFTDEAVHAIYEATQGLPRRISLLCHDALERLVMDGAARVTGELIQALVARERQGADISPLLA
jgi:type II secretory pathway predicted ATPase ExeA